MTARRTIAGFLLAIAGVATTGFFAGLLAIADCGPGCVESGERAPAYAAIGVGVSVVALGLGLTWQRSPVSVYGAALIAGGLAAGAGVLMAILEGARAEIAWVLLALGVGCAIVGAFFLRMRGREQGP